MNPPEDRDARVRSAAFIWLAEQQRGKDLGFALESRETFRIGRERLREDLDRQLAVERRAERAFHEVVGLVVPMA